MPGRLNLSGELAVTLRTLIDSARLPPKTRINEVQLAQKLDVSRTPLREALAQLAGEGAIELVPRHGYWTSALSADEVRELYPIRAALDPMALRLAGVPDAKQRTKLRRLNREFAVASEQSAAVMVDLDNRFHLALLSDCPNRRLLSMIGDMMRRTRRYELAFMKKHGGNRLAAREHRAILAALDRGRLEQACQCLAQNMTSATEPLVRWLEQDQATEPEKR